jgi:hypothetical protein
MTSGQLPVTGVGGLCAVVTREACSVKGASKDFPRSNCHPDESRGPFACRIIPQGLFTVGTETKKATLPGGFLYFRYTSIISS